MSELRVDTIKKADGTGSLSVPAESGTVVTTASPSLGRRNRIINGDMRIDQRNGGSSVTVNTGNAFYSIDRYFGAGTSSSGVFTLQQSTETPAGFNNSVKVTVTTSATASGTDNYRFNQAIEGFNTADFGWGSADAQTITLSFWVRSSLTGTFGGALQNADKSRNYPYTYTITAADTWEYKTITVSGDTAGTWVTNNGVGLLVVWCLGAADRLGTANTWSSTRYDGALGQVQLINTNGATLYITGVQLEVGSVATPFEHRSYGEELALCQRYYFKMEGIAQDAAFGSGAAFASTLADVVIHFPVTMRSSPTALEQSGTAGDYRGRFGSTISTLTTVPLFTGKCTPTTARVRATASGWTVGHGGALLANNANAFLAWSAEL